MSVSEAAAKTFQIDANELLAATSSILVFASTDDYIPSICNVSFHVRPGCLYLSATDRYCLGQLRVRFETRVRADFIVPRGEITRMARYFRPVKKAKTTLKFEIGDTLTIEESGTIPGLPGVRASFKLYDGTLPNTDKLLGAVELAADPYVAGYNPQYMARFAKVQKRFTDTVRVTPTGFNKPTYVTIGDYFRGLIMPVRESDTEKVGEPWPPLSAKAPAPKSTRTAAKAPAKKVAPAKPTTRRKAS